MVEIIETNLQPTSEIRKNIICSCIIIDHTGETYSDINELDKKHKNDGHSMFTHHYLVKKNGYIFRGRYEKDESYIDEKFNFNVIGIMVEGNFDIEEINETQFNNLMSLIQDISYRNKYIGNNIFIHSEVNRFITSPGRLFPFVRFKNRLFQNYINVSDSFVNIRGEVIYSFGSRNLEYKIPNMTGNDIYALKLSLIKIGCELKNVDDIFDKELLQNIKVIQKKYKMEENGIVNKEFYILLSTLLFKEGIDRSNLYQKYLNVLDNKVITGNDVKLIKTKLRSLNLYEGEINEIFDEEIKQSVIRFQARNGIPQLNGEVGPLTFLTIMKSRDFSFKRVLELVDPIMQGADVEIVQEMLQKKGYYVDINGYFDTKMHNAICQYQLDNNYLIDGKVDEELFEQILS